MNPIMLEYSDEYIYLLKEYAELDLMERLIKRNQMLTESSDLFQEETYFSPEGKGSLDVNNIGSFKIEFSHKKENFISRIIKYILNLIKKIVNVIKKIFKKDFASKIINLIKYCRWDGFTGDDYLKMLEIFKSEMKNTTYLKRMSFILPDVINNSGSEDKDLYDMIQKYSKNSTKDREMMLLALLFIGNMKNPSNNVNKICIDNKKLHEIHADDFKAVISSMNKDFDSAYKKIKAVTYKDYDKICLNDYVSLYNDKEFTSYRAISDELITKSFNQTDKYDQDLLLTFCTKLQVMSIMTLEFLKVTMNLTTDFNKYMEERGKGKNIRTEGDTDE